MISNSTALDLSVLKLHMYLVIKCSETWESSKVAKARYFEPGATQTAFDECRISSGTAFNKDEICGKRIQKCYYQIMDTKKHF